MVSFLVLSLVGVSLVSGVAYTITRSSITDAVVGQLRAASALKAGEINRWIDEKLDLLETIAVLPGVELSVLDLESQENVRRLQTIAEGMTGSGTDLKEVLFLSTEGGRVVASSDTDHVGTYHASDRYFQEGRVDRMVQGVYPSPDTGLPQITLAVPIRGSNGRVAAVVAAHLNLDRLDEIVNAPLGLYESAESYLVTGTNEFVSGRRFGLPEFPRGVHSTGIDAAIAGETGATLYDNYDGISVLGAYRWIDARGFGLLVEVHQNEAFSPARAVLGQVLLFGLLAVVLLTVSVRWIAARIAGPVVAVAEAAERVAEGDFSATAPVRRKDEVGKLAQSFNTMTDRLRTLYADLQRQVSLTTRTLEALEESRYLLGAIMDNSTALVGVMDPDGRVQLMNRAFLELLEISSAEAEGKSIDALVPDPPREQCAASRRKAFSEGAPVEGEISWRQADGQERSFYCVWFPLTAEEETDPFGVGMMATELTERRRVEEERKRLEAQMRHAQKLESLGVLAGGIAHDFNNILAAILGHGTLAAEGLADGDQDVASHLDQVLKAAERASDLTNQMLAYAGRASLRAETVDLNQAIREMSSFMTVSLPKNVRLDVNLSSDPLPVTADPAQLSQVVMNLITNGAQAMDGKAGVVEVSTAVAGEPEARAVLQVRDTGKGMDPETVERVFDPFFTTKEQGRGLGLAAVMGIVNGLEGTVDVESRPGEGTTFSISFPLAGEAAAPRANDEADTEGAEGAVGTVLVVDDEDAVRAFTARALERQGYRVLQAEDGLAALDVYQIEGTTVDAVVLDLSMPGMGGEEVFRELRARDPELPVLFTSGYDPSNAAGSVTGQRRVRFLQKPYRPKVLTQEVGDLLAEPEEPEEP